jgi:hypothetical protein
MPKKDKDVLAIMLGGKPPKGAAPPGEEGLDSFEEEVPLEEDSGYGGAFEESAEAAFEAASAGDKEGFITALKDAIVTCLEEQGLE